MTEYNQFSTAQRHGTVMVNRPALQAWLLSWTNAPFSTALPQLAPVGNAAEKKNLQLQIQKAQRSQAEKV